VGVLMVAMVPVSAGSKAGVAGKEQGRVGHDKLIEAHAFAFHFARRGRMERLGHAHIQLAAVLPPLRTNR
jgi:hypothetical protein